MALIGKTATCPSGNTQVSSRTFTVNGTKTWADITGRIHSLDTVKVKFYMAAGCVNQTISFVTYSAPSATYTEATADQETVYQSATGSYNAGGPYYQTVQVPPGYFQIDFIRGNVITKLGPAGTNNFYTKQGTLIDVDNGGTYA